MTGFFSGSSEKDASSEKLDAFKGERLPCACPVSVLRLPALAWDEYGGWVTPCRRRRCCCCRRHPIIAGGPYPLHVYPLQLCRIQPHWLMQSTWPRRAICVRKHTLAAVSLRPMLLT